MEELGHWEYLGGFDPEEWFGFIYRIIDVENGREYIGKKQFHRYTKKKVKTKAGGTKNKNVTKSSDWKKYTSSSAHVNAAIEEKGKEKFIFLIESLHKTKASLHYAEIEAQVNEDVLRSKLPDGTRKYYNGMIGHVKFIPPTEVSDETKNRIRQTLKMQWINTDHHYYNKMSDEDKRNWDMKYRISENNATRKGKSDDEYAKWLLENFTGENNPMYGRTGPDNPNYGKNPWQNLSIEAIEKIKQKLSELSSGENNPRYGKSPFEYFSEEQLEEHKKKLSERMSGENNPMFGVPCTYKMSDEEKKIWKKNISESTKGKPKSEETKRKMRVPKPPQPIIECPHCNKKGAQKNMKRYHFENCKLK